MASVGFTFSFPMTQKGLDVGILVSWTKSFNCSGVVGEDAVRMLNDAIHRRGDMDVDVIAVLNDTTGLYYFYFSTQWKEFGPFFTWLDPVENFYAILHF